VILPVILFNVFYQVGSIIAFISDNDGLSQDTEGLLHHFTAEGIAEINSNHHTWNFLPPFLY